MLSNALKIGGSLYSDNQEEKTNKEIMRQLTGAQQQAADVLQLYQQAGQQATGQLSQALSAGFQPGDLTQDPGYQFQLQQGNQALERSLAARGLGQSGAALKAAQEFGQGLADTTYNDAYNRWLQKNQQVAGLSGTGLNAAGNQASLYGDIGGIRAAITSAGQQNKSKRLSEILSGIGGFF